MPIPIPENFYRQTITRAVTLTGATNIYVSAHPSPDEGYITISPASSTLREIVYYTAKGTDGNGTYLTVTLANRGLGGTTAQTHAIGEPVRMNVTAQTIQDISDAMDQIVAAGAQDATVSIKGISRGASEIELGVVEEATDAEVTAGTATGATGAKLFVTPAKLQFLLGGNGSDGDVTVSSGTTTLTRDMNYNTLIVSGTGIIETAGYRIFCKGALTVDSSSGAVIRNNGGNGGDAVTSTAGSGGTKAAAGTVCVAGGAGGNGGAGRTTDGTGNNGVASANITLGLGTASGGTGGNGGNTTDGGTVNGGTGAADGAVSTTPVTFPYNIFSAYNLFDLSNTTITRFTTSTGGGGGGGGAKNNGALGSSGAGGGGGSGGGCVWISAKSITLTGSNCITANGGNGGAGSNGVAGDDCGGGGGGGGGSGGVIILIYRSLTGSGYSVAGGSGGTFGTGVGSGAVGTVGAAGSTGTTYLITA